MANGSKNKWAIGVYSSAHGANCPGTIALGARGVCAIGIGPALRSAGCCSRSPACGYGWTFRGVSRYGKRIDIAGLGIIKPLETYVSVLGLRGVPNGTKVTPIWGNPSGSNGVHGSNLRLAEVG